MKRVLEPDDVAKMISILDNTDARKASQEKAQELVDQAMSGLEGLTQDGMNALAEVGRWAAEGGW